MTWAPVVRFPLVYEDRRDAQLTLEPARTWEQVTNQLFRAVTVASRGLDLVVWGVQPWGFHLSSVIWHLVAVWLLLAVAWLTLPPWGAIAAAGIFAVHPLQVEAVTYVSARADVLAAVAVLLALYAASVGSVAGAVVGVVLASLSKETAGVAWALVPLWAAWVKAPFPVGRWLLWGGLAACLGAAGVFWYIAAARGVVLDSVLAGAQTATLARLLALAVFPVGQTIDHDWAALAPYGPVALIGAIGLTTWAVVDGWPRRSWLAFGWLWTVVALLPRAFVPLYEGLHERHLYLVMVGWCLCAGHWLSRSTRVKTGLLWR